MKVLQLKGVGLSAILLLTLFGLFTTNSAAQDGWEDSGSGWEDSGSGWDDENNPDSTSGDAWGSDEGDSWGGDFSFDEEEEEEEPIVVKKPYVRFVPPYDSTRDLVTYEGVVEVLDNDGYEYEIDTIMFRAKKWMEEEFGKKELKDILKSQDVNNNASEMEYKIVLKGSIPCMVQRNDFVKEQNGTFEFRMDIRIREGRYRYRIYNLVHVAPVQAGQKEGVRTYFEYLMKSEDDIRYCDSILLAADAKITAMVEALSSECHNNPVMEEDDW